MKWVISEQQNSFCALFQPGGLNAVNTLTMYYSDHPVWADAHTIILLDLLLVHKCITQTRTCPFVKYRHAPPTHLAFGEGTAIGW